MTNDIELTSLRSLEQNLAYEKSMHLKWKKEALHIHEQLEIAIATEKTELGRSVLKQFQETIS